MTLEEAIYARLSASVALSALIAGRLYPLLGPPDALSPYVSFQRIDGQSDHTLSGPSGLSDARVQIDCWSAERDGVDAYAEARRAALAVKAALDGFRGIVSDGGSPDGGLMIKSARLESDQDLKEDDPHIYRVSLDFLISFDEES